MAVWHMSLGAYWNGLTSLAMSVLTFVHCISVRLCMYMAVKFVWFVGVRLEMAFSFQNTTHMQTQKHT